MSANCATIAIDPSWHQRVAQAEAPNSLPDDWNDPMVAQSTAGTTGLSKFTIATHLQFYFRIASYRELMPAIRPHRLLASLPLFFGYGRNVYLLHLLLGSTLVLYPSVFTAAQFVDAVKKHRANVAAVVPATVRQLLGLAGSGQPLLPELGLLMCSGAPLFADEKRAAVRNLTPNFYDVYAASALGPISVLRPDDISERADSVGRPFPLSQVISSTTMADQLLPTKLGGCVAAGQRSHHRSPATAPMNFAMAGTIRASSARSTNMAIFSSTGAHLS